MNTTRLASEVIFLISGYLIFGKLALIILPPAILFIRWIQNGFLQKYPAIPFLIVFLVSILTILTEIGTSTPRAKIIADRNAIGYIIFDIRLFKCDTGAFPLEIQDLVGFSRVAKEDIIPEVSFSHRQSLFEGPLLAFFLEKFFLYEIPGLSKQEARQVFQNERIYLRPLKDNNSTSSEIPVIITGPNVLYRNAINIGFLDGSVKTLKYNNWKKEVWIQDIFIKEAQSKTFRQ
jgi:prepilin-type processing-associated H-X9-DG protein